jgi:hypothetical protein
MEVFWKPLGAMFSCAVAKRQLVLQQALRDRERNAPLSHKSPHGHRAVFYAPPCIFPLYLQG